jgi:RNase P protein component
VGEFEVAIRVKADNPSYGSKRISLMVTQQLGIEVSQTTVRNVLKRQLRQPTKPKAPKGGQSWKNISCKSPQHHGLNGFQGHF